MISKNGRRKSNKLADENCLLGKIILKFFQIQIMFGLTNVDTYGLDGYVRQDVCVEGLTL